ncbi:hypothetical protein BH23GEM9_BH23GEM9_01880 [soil metagenome]
MRYGRVGALRVATMLVVVLLIATVCVSDRTLLDPAGAAVTCDLPLDAIRRGDVIVLIRGFSFVPDTVHVRQGRSVTWVNCEPAATEAHTATAREADWTSPLLQRGDVFSHTFDSVGTFDYFCLPHSVMQAVVRVH